MIYACVSAALAIWDDLAAAGISLRLHEDGDRIIASPREQLTDDFRQRIQINRDALLECLRTGSVHVLADTADARWIPYERWESQQYQLQAAALRRQMKEKENQ